MGHASWGEGGVSPVALSFHTPPPQRRKPQAARPPPAAAAEAHRQAQAHAYAYAYEHLRMCMCMRMCIGIGIGIGIGICTRMRMRAHARRCVYVNTCHLLRRRLVASRSQAGPSWFLRLRTPRPQLGTARHAWRATSVHVATPRWQCKRRACDARAVVVRRLLSVFGVIMRNRCCGCRLLVWKAPSAKGWERRRKGRKTNLCESLDL